MKIYLAQPINGRSYSEVVDTYNYLVFFLRKMGYETLSPMTGKGFLRNEIKFKASGYDNPVSTNHAIIERDHWMVSLADVVFVWLSDSQSTSIGCMMELAWAYHLGKHSIVVMEKENIHNHAFVLEAADIVFETIDDALKYLEALIQGN